MCLIQERIQKCPGSACSLNIALDLPLNKEISLSQSLLEIGSTSCRVNLMAQMQEMCNKWNYDNAETDDVPVCFVRILPVYRNINLKPDQNLYNLMVKMQKTTLKWPSLHFNINHRGLKNVLTSHKRNLLSLSHIFLHLQYAISLVYVDHCWASLKWHWSCFSL